MYTANQNETCSFLVLLRNLALLSLLPPGVNPIAVNNNNKKKNNNNNTKPAALSDSRGYYKWRAWRGACKMNA
jgi:hypothetical protein